MASEQSDNPGHEPLAAGLADSCPNCHAPLKGNWCYNCGQSQKPIDRFFLSLVSEAFDDVFSWDSRTARTLFALTFRPGFLTTEYFAGRRARYLPPLRLYLISSIVFFFLLSLQLVGSNSTAFIIDDKGNRVVIDDDSLTDPAAETNNSPSEDKVDAGSDPDKHWSDDIAADYDGINFGWLSESHNQLIRDRLKIQTEKAGKLAKDEPMALVDALIDVAPPVMFILLPIFAVLLKLSYLGSGRYYTEHLILAVYNHSFLYLILILDGLANATARLFGPLEYVSHAIQLWIPLYMFLSLKQVYRQGFMITAMKYAVLVVVYSIIFFIAVAFAFVLGVMTL